MLRIVPEPESVAIRPGESRVVAFQLVTESGAPLVDRVMQFSILDDPGTPFDDAQGATLSFPRSITNQDGRVSLQIIAGLPSVFRVRASAPQATSGELVVFVTSATHASVEVAASFEGTQPLASLEIYFYDSVYDNQRCVGLDPERPPRSKYRPARSALPTDVVSYGSVGTEGTHALLVLGLDDTDTMVASGCVDLPGATLHTQETARLVVPLHFSRPRLDGQYRATSTFQFRAALAGAATLAEAWKQPSACPLDPARLWLDCTLDALASSPLDPSDCRPSANEGPVGDKILNRRGVPLAGTGTLSCHDRVDRMGSDSLESLLFGLFPNATPLLVGLPSLGTEARQLLEEVKIESELTFEATFLPDEYQLHHKLRNIVFPLANTSPTVALAEVPALITRASFIPAIASGNEIAVSRHGFTLRLGAAARRAFVETSLKTRTGATTISAFVISLFSVAAKDAHVGCHALDAVVTAEIGEPPGSLVAPCMDGLAALTNRLGEGFGALDWDDLDLFLAGSVAIFDSDQDRKADMLGGTSLQQGGPGLWSGELRTRAGVEEISGIWTAARVAPSAP